jgi:hypothetical protein
LTERFRQFRLILDLGGKRRLGVAGTREREEEDNGNGSSRASARSCRSQGEFFMDDPMANIGQSQRWNEDSAFHFGGRGAL